MADKKAQHQLVLLCTILLADLVFILALAFQALDLGLLIAIGIVLFIANSYEFLNH